MQEDHSGPNPVLAARLSGLRQRDLNALITLFAVVRLGSVSAAARLLGLTQPAVSRTLERLRAQFDDPLMIREGNGMVPTSRARQLAPALEALLDQAQRIFVSNFDPGTVRRDVCIAMNEHLQQLLVPGLLERVTRQAPGISLFVRPMHHGEVETMQDGHIDLLVGMLPGRQTLREKSLMEQQLLCLARSDLVRRFGKSRPLSLDAFRQHLQIDVQPAGMGHISASLDDMFAVSKKRRNVVCVLSSFDALMNTLDAGHHIGVVPALAFDPAVRPRLKLVPLAFDLPRYKVSAWWHNVAHHDPVVRWLVLQLSDLCSRLATNP